MLNTLFQPVTTDFSGGTYLLCTLAAIVLGIIIAATLSFKSRISKSFLVALIVLPAAVETVIMLVNGSVGTGIAVMGAFSLVRFRSVPGTAREIVAIILAMAAGLACAQGYIGIAAVFTVLLCGIILLLSGVKTKSERESRKELHITVPESLNYSHAFDDVFGKYAGDTRLISVKTTNLGSMYKLKYSIAIKSGEEKNMIDELRCRNGNLEIAVCEAPDAGEAL